MLNGIADGKRFWTLSLTENHAEPYSVFEEVVEYRK
jgi:hypothetical protein